MTRAKTNLRIAEVTTLLFSLFLIAAVVAFLVREVLQKPDHYNEVRVRPLLKESTHRGSLYVVPIEVENLGRTTLSNVALRVETSGTGEGTHDVSLDYLGARGKATVYILLKTDPRAGEIRIHPLHYQVE